MKKLALISASQRCCVLGELNLKITLKKCVNIQLRLNIFDVHGTWLICPTIERDSADPLFCFFLS